MHRPAILYLPDDGPGPAPRGGRSRRESRWPAIDGLEVIGVIGDRGGAPRSGLTAALELISRGEATVLGVTRLRDVASTLDDLVRLLEWLEQTGADLIAADIGFDSGGAGGPQAVALLREIDRWDREPHPARPPRGRPGLSSVHPQLVKRLTVLRDRGLSLQAIADRLNAERVPTPRGGTEWRPSSVQAALGYRRPRPPGPGGPAPHHKPPGPPA